jgi:hypothetical protein
MQPNPQAYGMGRNPYNPHPEAYEVPDWQRYLGNAVGANFGMPLAGEFASSPEVMDFFDTARPYMTAFADFASFVPGLNTVAIPAAIALHAGNRYAAGDTAASIATHAALDVAANYGGLGLGRAAGELGRFFAISAGLRCGFVAGLSEGLVFGGFSGAISGGVAGYDRLGDSGVLSGAFSGGLCGAAMGGAIGGTMGWFSGGVCFVAGTQVVVAVEDEEGWTRWRGSTNRASSRP